MKADGNRMHNQQSRHFCRNYKKMVLQNVVNASLQKRFLEEPWSFYPRTITQLLLL